MNCNHWRAWYSNGDLVRVEHPERVSAGWATGRLREGDHLVVCAHTGDYLHDMMLVRPGRTHRPFEGLPRRTLEREKTPEIGAYAVGSVVAHLSDEAFHQFMGPHGWTWWSDEEPAAASPFSWGDVQFLRVLALAPRVFPPDSPTAQRLNALANTISEQLTASHAWPGEAL